MKRKLITGLSLGCALMFSAVSYGQLSTSSAESLVNVTTSSAQQNPAVAMDSMGRYVVIWESEGQDGDGFGIYAQIYNADHSVRVPEFLINTEDVTGDQRYPAVDMDVNGNFTVAWQSNEDDLTNNQGWDVYRKLYDIDANLIGSRFRVNSTTSRNQKRPAVAMNENFVLVTFMSQFGVDDYAIRGRFYQASNGAALQSVFTINTGSSDHVVHVDADMDDAGKAIIVWQADNQDGDGNGVYAAGYQQPNSLVFSEVQVNTTTAGNQQEPAVAVDSAGNAMVVWSSFGQDGDHYGVFSRTMDTDGSFGGSSEVQVNVNTASGQDHPNVSTSYQGDRYVVTWTDENGDADGEAVYGRSYEAGTFQGSEQLINTTTNGNQMLSDVAFSDEDYDAIIVWQGGNRKGTSSGGDNDGFGVFTEIASVVDITPPTPVCQNITAYLSAAGTVTINPADIDGGSTDNVGVTSLVLNNSTFNCSDIGTNSVILTVGDAAGNTAACGAIVTVLDTVSPTATCQNITVYLDGSGNVSIVPGDVDNGSSDNCALASLVLSQSSFTCANVGANTVTLTATDLYGNTGTCTSTVTVIDSVTPTALCGNLTVYLDGSGNASITPGDVDFGSSDNCGINTYMLSQSSFTCADVGANSVTMTVTDAAGNSAACTSTVTVIDSVTPTASCQNITVYLDAAGNASITPADIDNGSSDNCGTPSLGIDVAAFNCADLGANNVTLTATDNAGNIGSCVAVVTVLDTISPVAITLAPVTGECSATATAPTTTDNCAGTITGTTSDPVSYGSEGTYTITWTFDDGNGNTTNVGQTIIVDDVTAPVTPTLADVTAECSVTATAPTTTDNCAGTITGTTTDPTTYTAEGSYVITWTFNDGNGNSTTATQNVIIDDVTAPTTPTLADVTEECSATVTAPTTMDNCAGTITGTTTGPTTYTAQGSYVITWTFNDGNGNSTTATQNVIVDDVTAPVTPTLADVTGDCSATATAPTTTDACAGTITGTTTDPLTYNTQGTFVITWTFDDGNGNSTTATQNVIVDDVTAPVTPTLADVTGECSATATAPTTTDACAGTITGTTTDPLTYNTQGTFVITWTFDDGNGNTTTATQNVVVDDVTAPSTPTLADVTGECSATATAPTTTDNCSGTITGTTTDATTYTAQGTYVITWTFDDGNGNTTTAMQNVIVDDVTAPVTPTLADLTDECSVTATAPTTTDNCSGTVTGTTTDPTSYTAEGTYVITWTFDDGNGNTTTATQNVIIDDVTAPATPTLTDVTGECTATATAPTTTDNCAGTITGTTTDPLTYSAEGTYVITWTFDDGNGNTSTATQNVIIDDVTAPVTPTLADVTGECSATATAPTTTDNCAGTITGTTTDPLTYTAEGTYVITWIFDDGNGNTTTAMQNVIIDDVTAPVTPTLADVTEECSATVTAPTTTDNCAGTITGTTTDPLVYNTQGSFLITWTFDDGNGNSTTATQNVIINDVTAPVTPTLADVTGECDATATAPTTTDACSGTITGTTTDPTTYTAQGTYVITWTFDDGNGNTTTAMQNVIVDDVTAPTVPTLADVTGECDATATAPTTTDNCSGTITGTTTDPLTYNTQGTYVITWTFDDGNGNTSTATQNVIVDDVTAPTVPTIADLTDECSATATAPTTTDNCSGAITGTTTDPLTYSTQGTFVITWTFDDGNGNTSTATQNVIISDVTAPTASNIDTVYAECIGDVLVDVTLVDDEADNCATTPIVTYVGDAATNGTGCNDTITRTYNVADDAGNNIDVTQIIIVNDITAPTASNPDTVNVSCLADVPAADPTVVDDEADNCSAPLVAFVGEVSTNGTGCNDTITRTYSVTDACGNQITVEQLIIVNDDIAPVEDVPTLMDFTGFCDITPPTPTATDNCAGTLNGVADVTFPITTLGTTVVTWTYTDACGNTTTQTQNVILQPIDVMTTQTDDITVEANNGAAGVMYQWIDCANNAPIAGATGQSYTATYNGDFAVIVTQDGCSDTSACVTIDRVGLDQLTSEDFMIYPNPSTGQFTVSFDGNIQSIEMVDVTGRIVMTETEINQGMIDASLLAPGKYMVRLTSESGTILTQPIVIGQK